MQEMTEQSQSNDNVAKQGLIKLNALEFKLPPDLSVVVSRTMTSQFFSQNAYVPGSTAVCILNTGASYIYGPHSYLAFTFKNESKTATTPSAATFGSGSAANLIRRITITSRSGDVLERVDAANLLTHIMARYNHDRTWYESVGANMGYGGAALLADGSTRYVIPMSEISGLFKYPYLLPSALCSGMRIEIEWESGLNALVGATAADVCNYSISDIRIEADSYQLTDLILRELNNMASQTGLEVVFSSYFTTQAIRTTSSLNVESRKAVSRALTAVMRERTPKKADAANTDAFTSDNVSESYGCTDLQWRCGSIYLPNTSIRNASPVLNAPELYTMAMRSLTKSTSVTPVEYSNGHQVFAVDLERSTSTELSGIPISNSRVLAAQLQFKLNPAQAMNVDLFLEFVTLARVFLSNSTIEI